MLLLSSQQQILKQPTLQIDMPHFLLATPSGDGNSKKPEQQKGCL
jgi:hypothetical protein